MRDIAIFTTNKPYFEGCIDQIKKSFKNVQGSEYGICIGKPPKSAQINFACIEKLNDIEAYAYPENFKTRMSLDNPYITLIEYHLSDVAKKVVESLMELYPEMLVYDDEDWLGPAKEYLIRNYEY